MLVMSEKKLKEILRYAIKAYVYELDQQDYDSDEALYAVLLNEFHMTEKEFEEIMGMTFAQWR